MSVPAARIRTSSGWRDIAIQGAPGIPGYTPSARAVSVAFGYSAADNAHRIYTPGLASVTWDDLGGVFPVSGALVFTCRASGKYLFGTSVFQITNIGNVNIAPILNDATPVKGLAAQIAAKGDGSETGGVETWSLMNLVAGNTIKLFSCHSGGGSAVLAYEAIRLDAPALSIVTNIPLVTSLPASPIDGQEVYYLADATNGVVWHLRYRAASASAYKWECIAGPPLYAVYATAENFPSSWSSGNPAITVPRAGEYDIEWTADINGAGVAQFYVAFYLDATRVDAIVGAAYTTANPQEVSISAHNRAVIAAGQIVRQGFIQTGVQGTAKNRVLRVRPVRLS